MKDELIKYHTEQETEAQHAKEGWQHRALSPWESDPNDNEQKAHIQRLDRVIDFHKRAIELLKSWS